MHARVKWCVYIILLRLSRTHLLSSFYLLFSNGFVSIRKTLRLFSGMFPKWSYSIIFSATFLHEFLITLCVLYVLSISFFITSVYPKSTLIYSHFCLGSQMIVKNFVYRSYFAGRFCQSYLRQFNNSEVTYAAKFLNLQIMSFYFPV
jgi:hypothetical protein